MFFFFEKSEKPFFLTLFICKWGFFFLVESIKKGQCILKLIFYLFLINLGLYTYPVSSLCILNLNLKCFIVMNNLGLLGNMRISLVVLAV